MSKTYQYLFFDLDHTLWDFERSATETKQLLFEKYQLLQLGIPGYDAFRDAYQPINRDLWSQYRDGLIDKATLNFRRFHDTLLHFGIDRPDVSTAFAQDFITNISQLTYLFPEAFNILKYLKNKGYQLFVLTNGFEEVQYPRLKNSHLDRLFDAVITSEAAQAMKPSQAIFTYAQAQTGADLSRSLMIGDDLEVDIEGARNFGMDQLWVNHEGKLSAIPPTYEVKNLWEITSVL